MNLDTKQVELIATSWLESVLMREGFEVARPIRDKGIDLIAFLDRDEIDFSAKPIQIKSAQAETFSVNRKYENRGIIMAYIWNAIGKDPEVYLVPYEEAVELLHYIGNAISSPSWQVGSYSTQKPSKKLKAVMEKYRHNFECLR